MGDPRVRIYIKISLDILFFLLVLSVYFVDIFQYMDDYYIGTTIIQQKTDYSVNGKSTPLTETIIASYQQFDDHFCNSKATVSVKQVCDKRSDFEISGILFLVFSCISHLFLFYGLLGLFGMTCGCNCCGFLKMMFVHYLYPIVYALSLILYITVGGVFSLDVPSGSSDDNEMKVQAGILLMFAAQLVALVSLI